MRDWRLVPSLRTICSVACLSSKLNNSSILRSLRVGYGRLVSRNVHAFRRDVNVMVMEIRYGVMGRASQP